MQQVQAKDSCANRVRDHRAAERAARRARAALGAALWMLGATVAAAAFAEVPSHADLPVVHAKTQVAPPAARANPAAPTRAPTSPYARAAAQRAHEGQAPAGHPQGQTNVQALGKPRKPHAPAKPH